MFVESDRRSQPAARGASVGESRGTCHPRNIEVNEICDVSFQEQGTHAMIWNLEHAKPRSREHVMIWNLEPVKSRSREHAMVLNLEPAKSRTSGDWEIRKFVEG
jgi:hypothetical protein